MKTRIDSLEERVNKLEDDYEEFDSNLKERYIAAILEKYDVLIGKLCRNSYYGLKLNFVDADDLKQEFLEYLLRWTYCESKRRRLKGSDEIWIPFIKRSFRNFIINFQIVYKRGGKRRPITDVSSLSSIEGTILEEKFGFQVNDLYDTFELKEYITSFYSKMKNSLDKKIFKLLVNPSEDFRQFTLRNFKKLSMFEIVAEYLSYSYSSVMTSYNRIKKSFMVGLVV